MQTIKLSPIPVEEFVPVRFAMPGSKHVELLDYLAYFNESHQSSVDLKALMPHLVAAFIADDRAFARWRAARSTTKETPSAKPAKRPAPSTAESS